MEKEGKYIYCIIETKQERNFGPIGIGQRGDEVLTIGYDDLSMIVSNYPATKIATSRENMLAHQRVIEEVMKEFDRVLPVRFGTIASSAEEVRNLLDRRYREFKSALTDMDHKIELGVKGVWKNMENIFSEIVKENGAIKNLKEALAERNSNDMQAKMGIGRMVKQALDEKKEKQAEEIIDKLRRTSYEHKLNDTIGDEMFMNAAFLVDKGREKEFDNIMNDLGDEYKDRIKFMYAGPLPVFNFVNIVIYPEEWEK
ncbi:MAG: gas vesicle synthesis GvpLGvpF [Planctomycetes bacterium HGW-Planctomycetes-1]|nr:MAG: gas vesicle synthesis GvpLGvpF [Planctomycetes bacterium HGW-Planctomycetes-1]